MMAYRFVAQGCRNLWAGVGCVWQWLGRHNILIWGAAGLFVAFQAALPMAMFWWLMHWQRLQIALADSQSQLPGLVFGASGGLVILVGTMSTILLKTALKRHPKGQRTGLFFLGTLFFYLFAAYMGKTMVDAVKATPGQLDILTAFYFGIYVLYLGWTTKPVWDRVTEDGHKALYARLYGSNES